MWAYWSALAISLLFAVGGSLASALIFLPAGDAIAASAIIVLSVAIVILGAVAWFSQYEVEPNSGKTPDNASRKQQEPEQGDERGIAALIDAQTDEHRAYRNERKREDRKRSFREWTTILLLLLAFGATFAQAIIFHRQLIEMERVYGPIQESATAGASAAKTAKDALIKRDRAFVFVKGGDGIVFKSIQEQGRRQPSLQINPVWENTGNTPTVNLAVQIYCYSTQISGLNPPFDYSDQRGAISIVLGPKQAEPMGRCLAQFPDNMDQLVNVPHYFYVGGQATYHDVFDSEYLHVTQYCREFSLEKRSTDAATGIVTFFAGDQGQLCPAHNCADEECRKKE